MIEGKKKKKRKKKTTKQNKTLGVCTRTWPILVGAKQAEHITPLRVKMLELTVLYAG